MASESSFRAERGASPERAERGASNVRSPGRSLFLCALLLAAIACAVMAAPSRGLVAQTHSQSHHPLPPPPPPYTPPPPGANLDSIGAKKLPDGPGKQIVEASCKDCHSFDRITMAHHSLARWRAVVRLMQQRGADVEPGDLDPLVHYLAQNFGLRHTVAKPSSPAPPPPAQ